MSFASEISAENTDSLADMRIASADRMTDSTTADALDRLTEQIIGAAIEANRELGPGMLESAYEACLAHELVGRGLLLGCSLTSKDARTINAEIAEGAETSFFKNP